MSRFFGVELLLAAALGASGCTSDNASFRPATQPQPSPTPAGTISISSISPPKAAAGGPDLTIAITGSNLDLQHAGSHPTNTFAVWSVGGSDTALSTTVLSGAQITVVVPAALLANATEAEISVQKWFFADDSPFAVSNSLKFEVTAASHSAFASAGNMLFARSGHSATLLKDGRVLIAGGDASGVTAEIYDPDDRSFTATGSMNHPRSGHSAVLLNDGRVLIAGGEDSVGPMASAEVYDATTGVFVQLPDMNHPRWGHTATLLSDGKVLVAGGADIRDSQRTAELFDPVTKSFSAIDDMTSARMHHTATLLANGRVLLVGGWESYDPITPLSTSELFEPSTRTFSPAAFLSTARQSHTAVLLPDGTLVVLGGCKALTSTASVETYGAASAGFLARGTLGESRCGHTVNLLPEGKLFVAGGVRRYFDQNGDPAYAFLSSAEIFDPASATSAVIGYMASERVGHTATLLKDGGVLITGGTNKGGTSLATAEVYK